MKRLWILLTVVLTFCMSNAFAGAVLQQPFASVVLEGSDSRTETKGYAGLVWTLGGKKSSVVPGLVVGVRTLKVKSNDEVSNGADLNARFSFTDGFTFDNARLSYVGGKRDVLGNVGVGYSFENSAFFSTIAVQSAYSRIGLDYEFTSSKLLPYLELLTIDKPKKVDGSRLACSDGVSPVPDGAAVGANCGADG